MRFLLVEDEEMAARMLLRLLRQDGRQIEWKKNCESAKQLSGELFDFIILDVRLPDGNGIELCRYFRRQTDCPILILTAADDEDSVVRALKAGADDYIIKPFRRQELLARMERMQRRYRPENSPGEDFTVDSGRQEIRWKGNLLPLTQGEFFLLETLLRHKGKMISREILLQALWGSEAENVESNTLSVSVSRLRKKLADCGCMAKIDTCWGRGYRLLDIKSEETEQ